MKKKMGISLMDTEDPKNNCMYYLTLVYLFCLRGNNALLIYCCVQ